MDSRNSGHASEAGSVRWATPGCSRGVCRVQGFRLWRLGFRAFRGLRGLGGLGGLGCRVAPWLQQRWVGACQRFRHELV